MKTKEALRAVLQREQLRYDVEFVEQISQRVVTQLRGLVAAEKPEKVLVYAPVEIWHEIDITSLSKDFPDVQFDVLDNVKDAPFPTETYDVIIVPLLGFTRDGFRLGRGGGWYDKFLKTQSQAVKIGVGYESSLVDFETESHDVSMNVIVTETQTRDFRSKLEI